MTGTTQLSVGWHPDPRRSGSLAYWDGSAWSPLPYTNPKAAWLPDPDHPQRLRFFDGADWTDRVTSPDNGSGSQTSKEVTVSFCTSCGVSPSTRPVCAQCGCNPLGATDEVSDSTMTSESRLHFERARSSYLAHDYVAALQEIAQLPPGRYESLLPVAAYSLRTSAHLQIAPSAASSLHAWFASFGDSLARTAAAAMTGVGEDPESLLAMVASVNARPAVVREIDHLVRGVPVETFSCPQTVLAAALAGDPFPKNRLIAGQPSLEAIDTLIDQGRLAPSDLSMLKQSMPHSSAYLTARLAPELLTDQEVETVGFEAEAARRKPRPAREAAQRTKEDRSLALSFLTGKRHDTEQLEERFGDHGVQDLLRAREIVADAVRKSRLPTEAELLTPFVPEALWAQPAPLPVPQNPHLLGPRQRRYLSEHHLHYAMNSIWLGDTEASISSAQTVVQVSREEGQRLEARNVLACAYWLDGNAQAAHDTLKPETASAAVQINSQLVSRTLSPEQAISAMARVVSGDLPCQLRVAAARELIWLWRDNRQTDGPPENLPSTVSTPLRQLARSNIPLADFRTVVRTLWLYDDEWLSQRSSLSGSPWANSLEAKFYQALTGGWADALPLMSATLKATPDVAWLTEERDGLVRHLIDAMLDKEPQPWAGALGLKLIDDQVPMPIDDQVMLTALACQEVAIVLGHDPEGPQAIAPIRLNQMAWAAKYVDQTSEQGREPRKRLVRACAEAMQRTELAALEEFFAEIVPLWSRLRGRQRRKLSKDIRPFLAGTIGDLLILRPYLGQELARSTDKVLRMLREMQ